MYRQSAVSVVITWIEGFSICNGTAGTPPTAIYILHWVVPLIALVLENVAIRLLFALHAWLEWVPWFGTTLTGATEVLNTVETLTISFIVFTFGSMLVAIQFASGRLTPRIIATALLRNNLIRFTVGLFTFTMLLPWEWARIETSAPIAVTVTWVLGIASIAAFLFLIDYMARLLRPISIVSRIAENGIKVIESVYPELAYSRSFACTAMLRAYTIANCRKVAFGPKLSRTRPLP